MHKKPEWKYKWLALQECTKWTRPIKVVKIDGEVRGVALKTLRGESWRKLLSNTRDVPPDTPVTVYPKVP